MSLTADQIVLVQSSFQQVAPISEIAAQLFYNRLFEIAPEVRPMFKGDMKEQGRKLMLMLSVAVNALNRLDTIVPALQDLGRRHVKYGVTKENYAIVGEALLWTLEQGLGDGFTPEVKDAWAATYGLVATTATDAAYSSEPV